jgi:hypothetical protein
MNELFSNAQIAFIKNFLREETCQEISQREDSDAFERAKFIPHVLCI